MKIIFFCSFHRYILGLILLTAAISNPLQAQIVTLASPNKKLLLTFSLTDEASQKILQYKLSYQGKPVVIPSRLGFELKQIPDVWSKLQVKDTLYSSHNTTWKPVYGERSRIQDHYNQLIFSLQYGADTNRQIQVIARAYDAGVAFQYHIPEQAHFQILDITSEQTHFTFPEGTKAYFTPRAQTAYELLPLQAWKDESERPLTLVLPDGLFACIAEAQMVNYARTKLALADNQTNTLVSSVASPVTETSPFSTPWRVIMVAEKPGQLIENNDIVLNLNPPTAIANTSWIKPGKVIREVTLSTDGAKACVDFAVQQGLQYVHFDAGWYGHEYEITSDASTVTVDPRRNPKGDLDLPQAIRYAKEKGIGVLLYVNHRALERQLDTLFPLYKSWGVSGVKFGFVHVGSHRWTTWLHEAVKKAAQHQLMVDIHDEYRPTGFSRTYPNLMTQEGIRGNEEMPDATHNTILPFTRFIAWAADYTVCYYYRKEFGHEKRHIKTTPAHQLALPVVYYSPLQWLFWYDKPNDYKGEPEVEFFKYVPTVWDDTKVLSGEIGQYITIARKSGEEWFIGSITNNDSRQLTIPLTFLETGRKYVAHVYNDGGEKIQTRTHVKIDRFQTDASGEITTLLQASGGQSVRLVPATQEDIKSLKFIKKWRHK